MVRSLKLLQKALDKGSNHMGAPTKVCRIICEAIFRAGGHLE